ncbi:hypothetical protein FHL15_006933 [Xylaria flabelliformis]|uniref:Uncharacterized protein n=1 Tax=Xylaria flabelliformis TaxID=2512241 RepID=A0A553HVT5_9PEZI|nr:hypothetical protein FHL15_006933 [Xylaria flabelliformis]
MLPARQRVRKREASGTKWSGNLASYARAVVESSHCPCHTLAWAIHMFEHGLSHTSKRVIRVSGMGKFTSDTSTIAPLPKIWVARAPPSYSLRANEREIESEASIVHVHAVKKDTPPNVIPALHHDGGTRVRRRLTGPAAASVAHFSLRINNLSEV